MSVTKKEFAGLVRAIRLLAADGPNQIASFPSFVHIPDELVSIFSDGYLLIKQHNKNPFFDEEASKVLDSLERHIESMEHVPNLWTVDALRNRKEWEELRTIAKSFLDRIGFDYGPLDLSGIQYLSGK